jgi:hypothetical protein
MPSPPIEHRNTAPVTDARRWPQLVTVGASLVLLAVSFTTFYRYTYGPVLRQLCAIDGSPPCRGALATRTAWHGYVGWIAVVLAMIAAMCALVRVLARRMRADRARALAYATLTLYLLAAAFMVAAAVAIPNLVHSERDLERTVGGGVRYSDLVTDHVAWGYWISLALILVGFAATTVDVVLLPQSATSPPPG